ncbi:MAG TPA: Na+/H+ antiporter [Mycobacteriales bacterium]
MSGLGLLAALLAGIVLLTPLADRLRVPQPILLLIFGLLLALVPGLPDLASVDADLVLPVVLPPLLFAATQRTTVGQFRDAAGPVLLLAVGLTVASAAVAAVVAHAVGLEWTAAVVLGAIVSPPDPVAATAVARRLRLPERLVTILEGEGMFNDATALVMYKVAVAVAVTGAFSAGDAAVELVLALVVGIAVGAALGWLTKLALSALHEAAPETTVTIAAPFIAYLGAEHLRGSGVLAVLVLGLYLRSYGHPALTAQGWLLGRSVWSYADFIITGLVFALVGFELTTVIGHSSTDASTIRVAVAVLLALIVLRPLWLFPAAAIARAVARRREAAVPAGWRETTVASWAGMRGVVTVATALALPATGEDGNPLAWRESVVLVALMCVLVTLIVQGLTLTPLVQRLGVGTDTDEPAEMAALQAEALRAALAALREEEAAGTEDPGCRAAILQYEGRLRAHEEINRTLRRPTGRDEGAPAGENSSDRFLAALRRGNDVERETVLRARTAGEVSPASADAVLSDIETRATRIY